MNYNEFEQLIGQMWEQIPERFREGISSLEVLVEAHLDPEVEDCPLLGDCGPDPALDSLPDTPMISTIRIFYGSFLSIAREEQDDFDWEAEAWETLLHEVRHHLEWRANHDDLGDLDDLQREQLFRDQGRPFDASFYRYAPRVAPGVTHVDDELFVEVLVASSDWERGERQPFTVDVGGWRLFSTDEREDWSKELRAVGVDDVEQLEEEPDFELDDLDEVTIVLRRRAFASLSRRRPRLRWR
jgi:hypothetical protein